MIVRWDGPAPCANCKSRFAQCANAGFPGGDVLTDKKPVTEAIWMQSTGGITKCILVHIDGELQPQRLHEWLKTVVFRDMVCDCRERMKLARKPWVSLHYLHLYLYYTILVYYSNCSALMNSNYILSVDMTVHLSL
jgi:hypothetical protein